MHVLSCSVLYREEFCLNFPHPWLALSLTRLPLHGLTRYWPFPGISRTQSLWKLPQSELEGMESFPLEGALRFCWCSTTISDDCSAMVHRVYLNVNEKELLWLSHETVTNSFFPRWVQTIFQVHDAFFCFVCSQFFLVCHWNSRMNGSEKRKPVALDETFDFFSICCRRAEIKLHESAVLAVSFVPRGGKNATSNQEKPAPPRRDNGQCSMLMHHKKLHSLNCILLGVSMISHPFSMPRTTIVRREKGKVRMKTTGIWESFIRFRRLVKRIKHPRTRIFRLKIEWKRVFYVKLFTNKIKFPMVPGFGEEVREIDRN